MATAMVSERGRIPKDFPEKPVVKKAPKRKSMKRPEQNNNVKRPHFSPDTKEDMLAAYQPWVIQTYGDLAKTKTVTLKKYARILRTLRGEEIVSADNSKFRFWVKAKGFHVGRPVGYDAKPADAIVGRYSVCDADGGIPPVSDKLAGSAKDPPLYVPNAPFKVKNPKAPLNEPNSSGDPVYRKVAVVENFFDIIYNVHVELEGRPGKHAGQKRTYRTITETYAFLPREAVTRFLLGCTECQKHPRSPSPVSVLPTPSPSPTPLPPPADTSCHPLLGFPEKTKTPEPSLDLSLRSEDIAETEEPPAHTPSPEPKQRSNNPLDVCNLTSRDSPPKKRHGCPAAPPKLWSPVESIEREREREQRRRGFGEIDYSLPITTTYLKYMRSLGCSDEDALKFESKNVSRLIEHFLHEAISHYFY